MRGLASLVMRGRSQAILVVATAAVLSFLVPPLSWLSAAAVALVTLRKGPGEGALVILGALVGAGILAYLSVGTPSPAASFLGVLWLPTWLVASLLRASVSLAAALEGAAALGMLVVLGLHAAVGDPAPWWQEMLDTALLPVLGGTDAEQVDRVRTMIGLVAAYMTGLIAAAGVLNLAFGLLIGRAWQAGLYNPGGFRREFHGLRLHPGAVLAVTLLVVSAWLLDGGPGLLTDLALVALVPAVLAGLATLHAVVGARGGRVGWLVALYALLFMALPQLAVALAALGLVNVWLDLGGRMARPPPPGAGRDSDD